ncbi:MAG: hypothetical protein DMF51_05790 [Acidobacteria bacterium]|nr:MAG: hypothetical protein DMF51_05790 [Acidobacteriota bacterium]
MRTRAAAVIAALVSGMCALVPAAPAPSPAGPPATPARPATLVIDPATSELTFSISRPGETIDGATREFGGEVVLDPADLSHASSVVLRVKAASLATGNRLRDRKMRGSHLEVDRFPEIVFRSTSIQVGESLRGAGTRKALVEGALSLHGVERTVLVPALIRYDNGTLTAEGSVDLTYSDYGIPIPRFLWLVMDDAIKVRFRFVAGPDGR